MGFTVIENHVQGVLFRVFCELPNPRHGAVVITETSNTQRMIM